MSLRRFLSTNRNADADQDSLQSDRPPTYTSNVTSPPTYTEGHGPGDRVRAWNTSVPSAPILSAPDSDALLDETESSLTDTVSVVETSAAATSPMGPRYSKRPSRTLVLDLYT
jgi:hypothetical protein